MECHSLLLPFSCQICTFKKNQKCISYLTKGEWLGWKLSNLWTPRQKRRNNCKHISTFSINGRKGNTFMKVLYHATQIRMEPRRLNWWFSFHCRFLGLNRNCLSRARGKHCSRLQSFVFCFLLLLTLSLSSCVYFPSKNVKIRLFHFTSSIHITSLLMNKWHLFETRTENSVPISYCKVYIVQEL